MVKRKVRAVARDTAIIAHDLLYVVGFVSGSRRIANCADSIARLERRRLR